MQTVSERQAYTLSRPGLLKQSTQNGLEKSAIYHLICRKKQLYFLHTYTTASEAGCANSNIRMMDLRTEEGDGRGHKA